MADKNTLTSFEALNEPQSEEQSENVLSKIFQKMKNTLSTTYTNTTANTSASPITTNNNAQSLTVPSSNLNGIISNYTTSTTTTKIPNAVSISIKQSSPDLEGYQINHSYRIGNEVGSISLSKSQSQS